jgi:cytochrome c biogenesis protein
MRIIIGADVATRRKMTNLKSQIPRRVWRFLARVDVAAVLIAAVLLLAALGSCFPQLSSSVADDPERLAHWETVARARYGALTDLLSVSRVFRWFCSPIFLIPLALLAIATLVCTLNRWRGVWRRSFRQPVRSDALLDAAPHAARLTAPLEVDLSRVVCECLERRDFCVRSETIEGVVHLRGDRNRLAPLATLVTHLAVLFLLLGMALSNRYGWREEIVIGQGETVSVGHGSRLMLRDEEFAITRYADGSVAGYEASVAVIEGGQEATRGSIRVNEPLIYGGVGLHLQAYAEASNGYSVTLLAVHDPGYSLVIAAGFLLLLGLTVSFNFPHCRIHARIEPEGTLRLAGRRAWDFGREFALLVEEIGCGVGEGDV